MTTMRFALLTGLLVAGGAAAYGMLQVPRLQDPPKAKVDRLTDADSDLLPVKPKGAGADDLLPVKSKGTPKDELLDPFADDNKPDAAERRRRLGSKAGKHPAPGINTNFSFDMVLGYQALVPGTGMVQSYYLLNSRQGHIGMDRGAIESMAQASAASDEASLDFQVITNTGNLYAYTTSSEMGRVAMTLHKEGGGATFELSYVMRKQQTFSGAGYKDMSALMGAYGRGAPGGF